MIAWWLDTKECENYIVEVGGDTKDLVGSVSIPSLVIKSIKVSGK